MHVSRYLEVLPNLSFQHLKVQADLVRSVKREKKRNPCISTSCIFRPAKVKLTLAEILLYALMVLA